MRNFQLSLQIAVLKTGNRLAGRWPRNADIEIAVFKTVFKTAIFDICEQLVVSSYSEEHERRHQTMIAVLKTVFKSVISMSAFL